MYGKINFTFLHQCFQFFFYQYIYIYLIYICIHMYICVYMCVHNCVYMSIYLSINAVWIYVYIYIVTGKYKFNEEIIFFFFFQLMSNINIATRECQVYIYSISASNCKDQNDQKNMMTMSWLILNKVPLFLNLMMPNSWLINKKKKKIYHAIANITFFFSLELNKIYWGRNQINAVRRWVMICS